MPGAILVACVGALGFEGLPKSHQSGRIFDTKTRSFFVSWRFWMFLVHPVKSVPVLSSGCQGVQKYLVLSVLSGSRKKRERQLLDDALQCLAMGGRYAVHSIYFYF